VDYNVKDPDGTGVRGSRSRTYIPWYNGNKDFIQEEFSFIFYYSLCLAKSGKYFRNIKEDEWSVLR